MNAGVQTENQLFLNQKTFDPWELSTNDPARTVDVYLPNIDKGKASGAVYGAAGTPLRQLSPGMYKAGKIAVTTNAVSAAPAADGYSQVLDLQHGTLRTTATSGNQSNSVVYQSSSNPSFWLNFWSKSDIAIAGDPEAQQVTHANMFTLASSGILGGTNSIPPMGYSSGVYDGHIFWDAEIWMFPALIAQHPDIAKGIIDYRFKHLAQAEALAKQHGFKGAEYPWESADTGLEQAPEEFSHERHITADISYAAWNYYIWTGDKQYLSTEAWPILQANAEYWASRVKKEADGKYHILHVVGPDETSGLVNDDAWTNAIVAETLRNAVAAASEVGESPDPQWEAIAGNIYQRVDPASGAIVESSTATDRLQAKQADAQMLIYPLGAVTDSKTANATLDYYLKHTMTVGPAMTSSIDAIVAARLGRASQSLDLFHDSYRPFMRGPWDAFSEKRTKDNVYFCTGMGGCLQTVLYGFAGLNVAIADHKGIGTLIAKVGDASLYADPHLPPGWSSVTVKGVHFRGGIYDIAIGAGNKVSATKHE